MSRQGKLIKAGKRQLARVRRKALREALRVASRTQELRAKRAERAGDHDASMALYNDALRRNPAFSRARVARSQIFVKTGQMEEALADATEVAMAVPNPTNKQRHRVLQGRFLESHPGWTPSVPGPAPTGDPRQDVVLYLAKESMPHKHNGYCTRTHETLVAVKGAGYTPVAVTQPGFPDPTGSSIDPISIVDGVEYHHTMPGLAPKLGRLGWDEYVQLATTSWARELLRIRPDVLHAGSGHRGYDFAMAGAALSRWSGLPWLYEVRSFFETTWTADERYAESAPYYHRRFAAESRAMASAGAVVTLSGPMRDEIVNVRGIDENRVFVIPNAVDLDRFAPLERDLDVRAKLGWQDCFVLGYVSNLDHYREGQEVLLDAVAAMRKQGRNVACLLVGDGRRRAELEKRAAKLGLGTYAHFTGSVPFEQVAQWYAQIDLFVVPRIDERAGRLVSPMKPYEAMAMKIPLMVSDLPALVEIAGDHEERAFVFEAGQAGSLAARAGQIMDNPAVLADRVAKADAWVRTERSWSANGKAFTQVYEFVKERAAAQHAQGLREETSC